ncbi:DNA polymerase epsilon subunit [Quillaja saponaria]|uniref:DNA polymerase epsilon subunit n=1 Tax=Quillaja saponaria TaxID=32244 RepID=A0AAD7Q5K0_QUISA|nr:DNA polymerase epsilon subunit [Quillaja saponaria]
MNAPTTRKKVQKKCKIRGYILKVDALEEILSFVSCLPGPDEDEAIDLLLDQLEHESLKSTIIDLGTGAPGGKPSNRS